MSQPHGMPPEYGVAPPMHEVEKSPKWPWVLLLILALVGVGTALYGSRVVDALSGAVTDATYGAEENAPPPPSLPPVLSPVPPAPAKRVVVFEVTGTGTAFNITAQVGASVQNVASVALPWTHTVEVSADEMSKSVMLVVVAGADGAEVSGRYTIDGTTAREGKASGPYGVLTITDR